jgi:hypothetical protein
MSDCQLSPSASAFSSMLSAFIGSVANGLFSGFWIAFFTGWISWLSFIRILAAGFYELWLTIKSGTNFNERKDVEYSSIGMFHLNQNPVSKDGVTVEGVGGDEETATQYSNAPIDPGHQRFITHLDRDPKHPRHLKLKPAQRTVTIFGWLGWIWSAIYTPLSHSIWLAVHVNSTHGPILLVRALAIGVSALGLTFDYKARYGAKLGRGWMYLTFNLWNSLACILLGTEATILLIKGILHLDFTPIPLLIAYPIFSIVWAAGSWKFLPPIDAARPGMNIFADVAMGCFAGIFCAAPAFGLWMRAKHDEDWAKTTSEMGFGGVGAGSVSSGLNLGDYLQCQGVTALERFAAVMP